MVNYKIMGIRNCIYRVGLSLLILVVCLSYLSEALSMSRKPDNPEYALGEILVRFNDGVSRQRIEQIVDSENANIQKVLRNGTVHLITLPDGVQVIDAVSRFSAYPEVKYAEPNYKAQHLEK